MRACAAAPAARATPTEAAAPTRRKRGRRAPPAMHPTGLLLLCFYSLCFYSSGRRPAPRRRRPPCLLLRVVAPPPPAPGLFLFSASAAPRSSSLAGGGRIAATAVRWRPSGRAAGAGRPAVQRAAGACRRRPCVVWYGRSPQPVGQSPRGGAVNDNPQVILRADYAAAVRPGIRPAPSWGESRQDTTTIGECSSCRSLISRSQHNMRASVGGEDAARPSRASPHNRENSDTTGHKFTNAAVTRAGHAPGKLLPALRRPPAGRSGQLAAGWLWRRTGPQHRRPSPPTASEGAIMNAWRWRLGQSLRLRFHTPNETCTQLPVTPPSRCDRRPLSTGCLREGRQLPTPVSNAPSATSPRHLLAPQPIRQAHADPSPPRAKVDPCHAWPALRPSVVGPE